METQIPLPGNNPSLRIVADTTAIRCERSAPAPISIFITTGIVATALVIAIGAYIALVVPATGLTTPTWVLIHIIGLCVGLFIGVSLIYRILEQQLFRGSRISRDGDQIRVEQIWLGNWRRTTTLKRPVELHVLLDPDMSLHAVLVGVTFFLQELPLVRRSVRLFGRWSQPIPHVFWVTGPRASETDDIWTDAHEAAIQQSQPLAEAIARTLGIPVVYALEGGTELRRVEFDHAN